MVNLKPRIFKLFRVDIWICRRDDAVHQYAYGGTPAEAYANWKRLQC
jgi:hypothetical protein